MGLLKNKIIEEKNALEEDNDDIDFDIEIL